MSISEFGPGGSNGEGNKIKFYNKQIKEYKERRQVAMVLWLMQKTHD